MKCCKRESEENKACGAFFYSNPCFCKKTENSARQERTGFFFFFRKDHIERRKQMLTCQQLPHSPDRDKMQPTK